MSAIRDITSIDLSNMNTLQGKLDALAKCTLLETLNLSGCDGYDEDENKVSEGLTGT